MKFKYYGFLKGLLFCVLSFLAGGINGFLGTGGGILFIYTLSFLTDNEPKDNFATTLCATLPISLVGSLSYFQNGAVDYPLLLQLFPVCMLGGIFGAFLTDKLKTDFLNLLFSGLVVYCGIRLLLR